MAENQRVSFRFFLINPEKNNRKTLVQISGFRFLLFVFCLVNRTVSLLCCCSCCFAVFPLLGLHCSSLDPIIRPSSSSSSSFSAPFSFSSSSSSFHWRETINAFGGLRVCCVSMRELPGAWKHSVHFISLSFSRSLSLISTSLWQTQFSPCLSLWTTQSRSFERRRQLRRRHFLSLSLPKETSLPC